MTGHIMSANQAKKDYGEKFPSIRRTRNGIRLRNSEGKKVTVHENTQVYHRGHGNFGIYSERRDKARYKLGARNRVGKGKKRHTKL